MPHHRLVRKDTLEPSALATAQPVAFDEINFDLLVELLLPQSPLRSRTQLRMQLEDEMAAAMETAMRGNRASFKDIYEFIPGEKAPGGIHKIRREPGPLLRELAESYCFVPIDPADIVPQPLIFRDETTGAVNELLTPGGRAELRGFDLRFRAGAQDEGVFLIDTLDSEEFRADVAIDGQPETTDENVMQQLMLEIPRQLTGRRFVLEVRSRPANTEIQYGRLPVELSTNR
jgi:Domain of unknown function (DUF4469) with IG-like fold